MDPKPVNGQTLVAEENLTETERDALMSFLGKLMDADKAIPNVADPPPPDSVTIMDVCIEVPKLSDEEYAELQKFLALMQGEEEPEIPAERRPTLQGEDETEEAAKPNERVYQMESAELPMDFGQLPRNRFSGAPTRTSAEVAERAGGMSTETPAPKAERRSVPNALKRHGTVPPPMLLEDVTGSNGQAPSPLQAVKPAIGPATASPGDPVQHSLERKTAGLVNQLKAMAGEADSKPVGAKGDKRAYAVDHPEHDGTRAPTAPFRPGERPGGGNNHTLADMASVGEAKPSEAALAATIPKQPGIPKGPEPYKRQKVVNGGPNITPLLTIGIGLIAIILAVGFVTYGISLLGPRKTDTPTVAPATPPGEVTGVPVPEPVKTPPPVEEETPPPATKATITVGTSYPYGDKTCAVLVLRNAAEVTKAGREDLTICGAGLTVDGNKVFMGEHELSPAHLVHGIRQQDGTEVVDYQLYGATVHCEGGANVKGQPTCTRK